MPQGSVVMANVYGDVPRVQLRSTGSRKAGSLWHGFSQFVKLCHPPLTFKPFVSETSTRVATVLSALARAKVQVQIGPMCSKRLKM